MNPIERALAKADTITTANNALEAQSRPRPADTKNYVADHPASLAHGQEYTNSSGVKVAYHSAQSYGDNGKRVAGATTGRYTITYPGGRTSVHEHGPQANTEGARKRGANPNAKQLTAYRVHDEVAQHVGAARMGFNDRRGTR